MLLQATHHSLANSHLFFHYNLATVSNILRLFEKLRFIMPPRMYTTTMGSECEKIKCHLVVCVKNSLCGPVSDINHKWLHFRQLNYTLCQWEMNKTQGVFRVWDYVFALENYCFSECSNFWKLMCTGPFWGKSLPNPVRGEQIKMLPEQKWIQNSRTLLSAQASLCQQKHRQRISLIFLGSGLWATLTHSLETFSQASINICKELKRKMKRKVLGFFFLHILSGFQISYYSQSRYSPWGYSSSTFFFRVKGTDSCSFIYSIFSAKLVSPETTDFAVLCKASFICLHERDTLTMRHCRSRTMWVQMGENMFGY